MRFRFFWAILSVALLACACLPLAAQTANAAPRSSDANQQAGANSAQASDEYGESKPARVEIFGGYSWMSSADHITRQQLGFPLTFKLGDANKGGIGEFSIFLNRWAGITLDGGGHTGPLYTHYEALFGPTFRFPGEHFQPFIHFLGGWSRLSPFLGPDNDSVAGALGGGIDLKAARRLNIRLLQADYLVRDWGNPDGFSGPRLSTGLVLLFGVGQPAPVSAACSVDKSEVWAGEPVTATVAPRNFNPKHTLKYDWSTNGGKVNGQGDKVTIDTTGVAEGQSYTVSAHVTDPKEKKLVANCQSSFATKKRLPPTISCNANPTSVTQGEPIVIHSNASSPQGGPVTVAVQSDCGASGQGTDVNVNTASVQPGSCTVRCTVTDDHQLTATSSTTFAVQPKPTPTPPPPPPSLALRSVYFATAQPTERNPQAGLVSSQQATLTAIATDFKKYLAVKPDAKLLLEAHADPRGSEDYNLKLTERRAARVKSFLVEHGVPADSLETQALGEQHQLTPAEVRQSMEDDPSLTPGEKARLTRNMRVIVLAANRRVDIGLRAPGVETQTSKREYPFSAADALSLIGGREKPKPATTKPVRRKTAPGARKKTGTKK